jgi:hypothetical protein
MAASFTTTSAITISTINDLKRARLALVEGRLMKYILEEGYGRKKGCVHG